MSAIISGCGTWRYRLDRPLLLGGSTIAFLLHNPSTADAEREDPTSRRGIGFARAWGAGHLIYINPWAGRATKPRMLWQMPDPVGPDNDKHITDVAREVVASGGFMVFAWGAISPPWHKRDAAMRRLIEVEALIRGICPDVRALGVTRDGAPRHPLYVRSDTTPVPWARLRA